MEAMLKNQVAIVTGAGSGMGKATALKFASEGANVVCVDLNEAAVKETAAEIEKMGRKALAVKCDITDSTMVKTAVEACIEEFGKIDIMANIAGWGGKTDDPAKDCIETFTEDKFDLLVKINLPMDERFHRIRVYSCTADRNSSGSKICRLRQSNQHRFRGSYSRM